MKRGAEWYSKEAKPTAWRDNQFRSALESKWAFLLGALRFDWLYEPEVFQLDAGRYQPDFWIWDHGMGLLPSELDEKFSEEKGAAFLEVKPLGYAPDARDVQRYLELSKTRAPVFVTHGSPRDTFRFRDHSKRANRLASFLESVIGESIPQSRILRVVEEADFGR